MTTTEIEHPEQNQVLRVLSPPGEPIRETAISMLPSAIMRPLLDEYVDRRKTFRDWLLSQLKQGVHFGFPPGCEPDRSIADLQWRARPSLYKAGADFICDLLQLDPKFAPDLDCWKMLGSKDGTIVIKCVLVSRAENPFFRREVGEIIGEGRGAGTAGVKRRDGNGAIKIAQKSAKVDAVINALGLSDLFTQDAEDAPPANPAPDHDGTAPKVPTRSERQNAAPKSHAVTEDHMRKLYMLWANKMRPEDKSADAFFGWCRRFLSSDLPMNLPAHWTFDMIGICRNELEAVQ